MEARVILSGITIGIGATFLVDLWNAFLNGAFGIRSLSYCMLGRWFCHMPEGTFRHVSIVGAPEKPFECAIGWTAHYTIGVVLALVFVVLAPGGWLADPSLLPALCFGLGTVVFPLFVLQPSLGLGIASSRTPAPAQARLKSLMTHAVFGVGLWVCALGVNHVLDVLAWG